MDSQAILMWFFVVVVSDSVVELLYSEVLDLQVRGQKI